MLHIRFPCPSQSPRVCSDSCPVSWWCYLTISSSAAFNLSHHQSLFQWVSSSHQVPKVWSLSFNISPSNEYSGLISFILCPNPEVLYQYLDIAIQSRKTGKSCSLHPLYSFCNYTTHTCKCKQKSCLEDQCSARHMHICWEANLTQWIRLALTHWKGNRQQSVGVNMQQRQTSSVSEEQEIINMADSTSSQ